MNNVKIITDGSCDLSVQEVTDLKIESIPFYVSFDSKTYRKEIVELNIRDFYQQMIDNPTVFPKSSCPTPEDYFVAFEKHAKNGDPVICLCITEKFSGSLNSATTAKQMCEEKYPNAKIAIINTIVNTVLQGLLVKETVRMRDNSLSFEEIVENVERIKITGRIFFTVNNLEYLRHGGRIGKLVSIVGKILKINPMITLRDGEIFSSGIAIGRKKAMPKIVEMSKNYVETVKWKPSDYIVSIGYGYSYEEAEAFKSSVVEGLALKDESVTVNQIGATISVHTGPYPLGIGLLKKYDA